MDAFLNLLFTFPTIFFTGLLLLAAMLWLAIIVNQVKPWKIDKLLLENLGVDEKGYSQIPFIHRWQQAGVPLSVGWALWIVTSWLLSLMIVGVGYPYLPEDTIMVGVALGLLVIIPGIAAVITLKLLPLIKPYVDSWLTTQKQRLKALTDAEIQAAQAERHDS
ncbi:MAG: hypothetical protein RLZZ422_2021 [Pseudomonadota bacterium]|jgi:hypothetical protein